MNAREDWLSARKKGIGGSDAAAVLGLSKWKTPLQLYQEKIGEADDIQDNESMLWGRVLEPVIRQQYAERTGRTVRLPEGIIAHPEHAFMLANVDGVTDCRRVVEIKTARSGKEWGANGSDEVLQEYLLQVQHYMAVTGFEVADIAVLIGGSDFRIYEVPADKELQNYLISAEEEFWERVVNRTPPDPVSFADMQTKFPASNNSSVEASLEALHAIESIKAIQMQIKALEEQEEEKKAIVMGVMGEAETLTFSGKPVVTWKLAKPANRFDSSAFKAEHPDMYSKYTKLGEASRRFIIK